MFSFQYKHIAKTDSLEAIEMIKKKEVHHDIPSKKTQILLVDYKEFQVPVSQGKNPAGYELFPESP